MSASFKDLRVWQEAMKFAVGVYRVTGQFPKHEVYGLCQQLRRAAYRSQAILRRARDTDPTVSLGISSCTHEDRSWRHKHN